MKDIAKSVRLKFIIKKCHVCGEISESQVEIQRCNSCGKSFLPLNYFHKVHAHDSTDFKELFSDTQDIHEDDLIKGIYVIW